MHGWLSRGLLIGGVFALVWLAVIYSWNTTNRIPNVVDVAFYFIAAPIALLIAVWLITKAWGLAVSQARVGAPSADSVLQDQNIVAHTAEQERDLSIAILASAIKVTHGRSADEVIAKMISNEASLNLDPELIDRSGFPILTGRIMDVDEAGLFIRLSEWAIANKKNDLVWTNEQLRAISFGSDVIIELAQQAVSHTQLETYLTEQGSQRDSISLSSLQLIAILPEAWGVDRRNYVADWFSYLIQEQGWPSEKITLRSERQSLLTRGVAAIDQLMLDGFRLSQPCFGIVIACDSSVGEAAIESLESSGKLLAGQDANSSIPGEGAAGLLLADAYNVNFMSIKTSAKMHRVIQNRRSKSADASGQISDQLLTEMVQDALAISKISAGEIKLICTDADHRASRVTELLGMGVKIFPELDSDKQYFTLTGNCGDIGAVASLAALVIGHHQVITEATSSLCISNIDSYERTVAVLSPWVNVTSLTAVITNS